MTSAGGNDELTCLFGSADPVLASSRGLAWAAAVGWRITGRRLDEAERLDVSRQSVNAIETGKYDPNLPPACKIARLFGLPIEAIFEDQ